MAWIPRWRPEVLFTHDPEHPYPPYLTHRDHRIVGRVALDVIYSLARDRLVFPETDPATLREGWYARADGHGAPVGLPLTGAFVVLTLD